MIARSCVLANPDCCETDDIGDDLLQLTIRLQIDGIIPEVFPSPPESIVGVSFESVAVESGNCISPLQTILEPVLDFPDVKNGTYTVGFFEVDVPSRLVSLLRFGIIGLFLNVKGVQGEPFVPSSGFSLAPYIGPAPIVCSGPHRIAVGVYQQEKDINTNSRDLINVSVERVRFDLATFVSNYSLGNPVAANYWISDNCCSVDYNNCCNTNEVSCNDD
ncbi:OV-16 antigen-like [Maniola jurtina]|uniref:OV-16 antigen-like n=1 Tax=Maniola jurtina TaxID=191418 RepID=UPI001E68CF33|nr:OV-16 antigen-like [Maniola jurtina]